MIRISVFSKKNYAMKSIGTISPVYLFTYLFYTDWSEFYSRCVAMTARVLGVLSSRVCLHFPSFDFWLDYV